AGARALPTPAEAFEAAIRADGKAVEANLRGFRAGWDAARAGSPTSAEPAKRQKTPVTLTSNLEAEIAGMPAPAKDIIAEGVRRLTAYQDRDYARLGSVWSARPTTRQQPAGDCSPQQRD